MQTLTQSSQECYEYLDLKPTTGSFLQDVVAGLSGSPKSLPPKYFYDARGAQLFDAICDLPEYYVTRAELALLQECASEIARRIGPDAAIVEYGSGTARKTGVLLRAARPGAYVAIDISAEQLKASTARLAGEHPDIRMFAVCADYTRALPLDRLELGGRRRVIFFPGSTIGNFTTDEARAFLANARQVGGRGGALVIGVDLKKDPALLNAAYNDASGVTAAFNLNLLERMNRELGSDFDLTAYEHRAHYAPVEGRVEMHVRCLQPQTVTVDGHRFRFERGETIHTENSYKYSVEEFQSLAREAGFRPEHCWTDERRLFSIHFLTLPE